MVRFSVASGRKTVDPTAQPTGGRRWLLIPSWAGRNYLLQTFATVITGLGNSGAMIASAFAVLHLGGGGTDVGLVATARTVPLVVFLLVGGAAADRMPRHRIMMVANSANAVSQAVFAALVLAGSARLWQMMLLSALGGTAQAFFAPASQGVILSSVAEEHAGEAFAAFRIGLNAATLGGAALGGALIASFGPGWVLAIDAGAFAVAAVLRTLMRFDDAGTPSSQGMFQDLRDGWQEFRSRRWLWTIVVQFSVVNGVVVASEAIYGPLVAQRSLGGPGPWGLALAGFGAGTLLGGLLMIYWKPRRPLFAGTLGVFPVVLPLGALAVPLPWPALATAMAVCGAGFEVFGVVWMVTLRQEIPADKLSRISAYDWVGSLSLAPACTALAGPAADAFGVAGALWGSSAAVVLLTLGVLAIPEVRQLSRTSSATAVAGAAVAGAHQAQPADAEPAAATSG